MVITRLVKNLIGTVLLTAICWGIGSFFFFIQMKINPFSEKVSDPDFFAWIICVFLILLASFCWFDGIRICWRRREE